MKPSTRSPQAPCADLTATYNANSGSLLLSLPAELRVMIWEYVCARTKIEIDPALAKSATQSTRNTGILSTCKQMREEAAPIYFSLASFQYSKMSAYPVFAPWRRSLAPQHVLMIKRFRVIPDPNHTNNYTKRLEFDNAQRARKRAVEFLQPLGINIQLRDIEVGVRKPNGKAVWTNDPEATIRWGRIRLAGKS